MTNPPTEAGLVLLAVIRGLNLLLLLHGGRDVPAADRKKTEGPNAKFKIRGGY